MKTLWNSSNYGNDLRLTRKDANYCTHSGSCDNEVIDIMSKPYVKKQLDSFEPIKLVKELTEYGCWDENELSNHADNLMRWVWISAGDITENN